MAHSSGKVPRKWPGMNQVAFMDNRSRFMEEVEVKAPRKEVYM